MTASITVRAPAKINLFLGVDPLGPDGFHPLDTVYQAVSLYDDITVATSAGWSVSVEPLADIDCSAVPLDASNIVIRAGRLLTAHHGISRYAAISIHKGIPVAGGMAGGSADAAATLIALDRLWDLQTTDEDLLAIAAELGSDVPFAMYGGTAHGGGRGEVVEPLTDRGTWWWVVVPNADGLSTPRVYEAFDNLDVGRHGRSSAAVIAALADGELDTLAASIHNDLTDAALSLRPDLRTVAAELGEVGVEASLLSGSGPTYLGLARDQDDAIRIRAELAQRFDRYALVATGAVAGVHVVHYV